MGRAHFTAGGFYGGSGFGYVTVQQFGEPALQDLNLLLKFGGCPQLFRGQIREIHWHI
jgi:hypothetical protein